jgi:16S rRNA (guanine(966)-N(2))-methyltransferase RsmD
MRIISGTLKGRRLATPGWEGVRPTSDKLRETLFNVLGASVQGARVLDGYAGSGAVGIEALSRGAAHVTFLDADRRAAALVAENLRHCGIDGRYAIIRVEFARAKERLDGAEFDIMFLDPPYGRDELEAALETAAALASPGTRVIVEHAKRDDPPTEVGRLVLRRNLVSGDSALAFYQRAGQS